MLWFSQVYSVWWLASKVTHGNILSIVAVSGLRVLCRNVISTGWTVEQLSSLRYHLKHEGLMYMSPWFIGVVKTEFGTILELHIWYKFWRKLSFLIPLFFFFFFFHSCVFVWKNIMFLSSLSGLAWHSVVILSSDRQQTGFAVAMLSVVVVAEVMVPVRCVCVCDGWLAWPRGCCVLMLKVVTISLLKLKL